VNDQAKNINLYMTVDCGSKLPNTDKEEKTSSVDTWDKAFTESYIRLSEK